MSLKHLADNMAAHGRHGDDMLVHVNKKELLALEALANKHGKSLTTNPDTGLPEAFGLRQILPMAAGAVLVSQGVDPATAGMIVGGASTAASGNIKQGMMDGLGAYGGAGLAANPAAAAGTGGATASNATNVVNTAAPASSTAVGTAGTAGTATTSLPPSVTNGLGGTYTAPAIQPISAPATTSLTAPAMQPISSYPVTGVDGVVTGPAYGGSGLSATATPAVASPYSVSPANMTGVGTEATKTGFQQALANANANPKFLAAAMAPVISDAITPKTPEGQAKKAGDADMGQRYEFEPSSQYSAPSYKKISNEDAKKLYGYAEGGDVQYPYTEPVVRMYGGGDTNEMNPGLEGLAPPHLKAALRGPVLKAKGPEEEPAMAGGGLSSLGGYSDGGRLLKGPGDGMSDNIPAQIGAKQPARLADGEFVVPADVVSHLGNGSTDAGAKQLYKMMDRIRAARTGNKKQGKQINPNKFTPA